MTPARGRRGQLAAALGRPLPRRFYARGSRVVARAVLGRLLVHDSPAGRVAGRIVEAEAYDGARDPASHAYRGRTPRNATMFGEAGHAYVYFTYGMHHCLNFVTGVEGVASAVLIRALEPVEGVDLMRSRRATSDLDALLRGPGNTTRALGLTREHDGLDLTRGPLWLSDQPASRGRRAVLCGPRIGVSVAADRPWRFWLEGHPCASAPRGRPARHESPPGRGAKRTSRLTPS